MRAKIILAALVVTFFSGCATQTATVHSTEGRLTKQEMRTFFVSGLGQTQTIDAAAVCGGADKVASVERGFSPLKWARAFLSSGVYTPLEARVYCR